MSRQAVFPGDPFTPQTSGLIASSPASFVLAYRPSGRQNSTDARPKNSASPVKIRIAYRASDPATAPFWRGWLIKLQEHLDASGLGLRNLDLGMPDFLVIEDFATTGLTGSVDRKDEDNFSDFWRRVGRSHKAGNKGGSWGLGKLVFPVASEIRTFFGLTIRDGDAAAQPLLMGQTVLTTHRINGIDFAPHGFFAVPGAKGFQLPVTDRALIARFSARLASRAEASLGFRSPYRSRRTRCGRSGCCR